MLSHTCSVLPTQWVLTAGTWQHRNTPSPAQAPPWGQQISQTLAARTCQKAELHLHLQTALSGRSQSSLFAAIPLCSVSGTTDLKGVKRDMRVLTMLRGWLMVPGVPRGERLSCTLLRSFFPMCFFHLPFYLSLHPPPRVLQQHHTALHPTLP